MGNPPVATLVYDAPDNFNQVGVAFNCGPSSAGVIMWALEIHDVPLPGKYVINNGRFEPIETDDAQADDEDSAPR